MFGFRIPVFGDIDNRFVLVRRNVEIEGRTGRCIGRNMRREHISGVGVHPVGSTEAFGVVAVKCNGGELQPGIFPAYHLHLRHRPQQVEVADVIALVGFEVYVAGLYAVHRDGCLGRRSESTVGSRGVDISMALAYIVDCGDTLDQAPTLGIVAYSPVGQRHDLECAFRFLCQGTKHGIFRRIFAAFRRDDAEYGHRLHELAVTVEEQETEIPVGEADMVFVPDAG